MKKIALILLCILLALITAACADVPANQPASSGEAPANTQGQEQTGAAAFDYTPYLGEYTDEAGKRASAKIEAAEDGIRISIHWADSSSESNDWLMTCREQNGKFVYADCEHTRSEISESGEVTTRTDETVTSGYFTVSAEGKLAWDGAATDACAACLFVKNPQA